MVKRNQRPLPATPPRGKPETKPNWPQERHSGEGSASALETLHKLEKRRIAGQPQDPPDTDTGVAD